MFFTPFHTPVKCYPATVISQLPNSPVFDLYQITNETIRSATLHKVLLGRQESFRAGSSKLLEEVVEQ